MIRYQLSLAAAARRARTGALARALASLAPLCLAVVVLRRLALVPTPLFWAAVAALVALVAVRAAHGYASARRRLGRLVVTVDDAAVRAEIGADSRTIERAHLGRLVEVPGVLGGLRVESATDPRTGEVAVLDLPSGGEGWGEVKASLGRWGVLERRGRRGLAVRLGIAAAVVAGLFFLPFLFDDFVARSRLVSAAVVVGAWVAVRVAMRVS